MAKKTHLPSGNMEAILPACQCVRCPRQEAAQYTHLQSASKRGMLVRHQSHGSVPQIKLVHAAQLAAVLEPLLHTLLRVRVG